VGDRQRRRDAVIYTKRSCYLCRPLMHWRNSMRRNWSWSSRTLI